MNRIRKAGLVLALAGSIVGVLGAAAPAAHAKPRPLEVLNYRTPGYGQIYAGETTRVKPSVTVTNRTRHELVARVVATLTVTEWVYDCGDCWTDHRYWQHTYRRVGTIVVPPAHDERVCGSTGCVDVTRFGKATITLRAWEISPPDPYHLSGFGTTAKSSVSVA